MNEPVGYAAAHAAWQMALAATLHCLTGCAIGEILGMAIGTLIDLDDTPRIVLSVALAVLFGYALAARRVMKAGLTLGQATRVALAAETVSITVMVSVENVVLVLIPGAVSAGLGSPLFWLSLGSALIVAFIVTLPVNRWLIAHGRGHAYTPHHH
ncbi:protein of unknown function [Micromonospora echinaurantiaca]|uniref:DUF4396 domain-containing protein n=1 Tax=Micromonospora echinaurantiaca TaxID=47857 RepID=A0A1C5IER5_9ACTN|nr:protein of unknown function [Micromonospora echinaurantiaca]